jgi:hypothetical protein
LTWLPAEAVEPRFEADIRYARAAPAWAERPVGGAEPPAVAEKTAETPNGTPLAAVEPPAVAELGAAPPGTKPA